MVGVLDGDLITEESCRAGTGVGDQRLFLGQFQLEVIAQELRQSDFDLLGFGLRPDEPEELIVGVAGILQPPVARVPGIPAGHAALLLAQLPHRGTITAGAGTPDRVGSLLIGRADCLARSPGVFRNERRLDELIQPVQVNIGEDR